MTRGWFCLMALAILLAACAAPGPTPAAAPAAPSLPETASANAGRVLTMVVRYEVTHLLPKIRTTASPLRTTRMFNAALTLTDGRGTIRPYLAETLPELNTDTWRVFPDGRMETTYRLRAGATWHDGQPLTADDLVFTWRVYTNPALALFVESPQHLMESAVATDAQTLVIRWRKPYPDAASIRLEEFDPLPRHILEQPYAAVEQDPAQADAFFSHPYWMPEYVGAGPYRLERWVPGAQFEGVAFGGHVLGRPKIDRIVLRVMADDNTVLTNVLAGTVDFASLRFEHGLALQRDWVPAGQGVVIPNRGGAVTHNVQLRPEYVGHPGTLDLRVRQAIAHALDRQAVNDVVFEGQGFMTDTIVPDDEAFYPELERSIPHYPFDPRRTEQLMNEAGFVKDRDSFFTGPAGDRYHLDFQTVAGPEFERIQLILTDAWRRAGIDAQPSVLPSAQVRGGQQRHTFPGLATRGGALNERAFVSAEIGTAENRWAGDNRAGWANPEYDRLWALFTTTLDRGERTRQFIAMQRLLAEQLPVLFTHFAIAVSIHTSALRGPDTAEATGSGTFTPATLNYWNVHEWEWRP